jgi:hypothetical protein
MIGMPKVPVKAFIEDFQGVNEFDGFTTLSFPSYH